MQKFPGPLALLRSCALARFAQAVDIVLILRWVRQVHDVETRPKNLTVFIDSGLFAAAVGRSRSFEYHYTLIVLLLDAQTRTSRTARTCLRSCGRLDA
ncbi:phage tail protein [Paraburkholderia sp. J94]|uniref:phage tail protein n=1 Tax=Paraburkholderia sp. J94 TaxID=2805441 RepID=UPI002AB064E8|nr:phage tail protein [Paraburkholderia sp. J94]